jgi:hypothetical protein
MSRNPFYIKMINSVRWKQLRAEKLRNNPICEVCDTNDLSTLATEVHHKIPVESVPHELGMRQLMLIITICRVFAMRATPRYIGVLLVIRRRRYRQITSERQNVL